MFLKTLLTTRNTFSVQTLPSSTYENQESGLKRISLKTKPDENQLTSVLGNSSTSDFPQ